MRKYRIAELYNQYSIEVCDSGDKWTDAYLLMPRVPHFFATLADARSWVATIKKGVVYHDAEDAPNLAQDERKAGKGNVIWDEWEEALARNIVRLLMARGTVNGITIHNVSIDDEHIRIFT